MKNAYSVTASRRPRYKRIRYARTLMLAISLLVALFVVGPGAFAANGDFSIDFVAAAPQSYNHLTGGGAYDDRTIGVANDVVESLEGGDFACGDIVTYFAAVTVDDTTQAATDASQTIEMDFSFLADTTGQSGVAIGDIVYVGVNYGAIEDLIAGENSVDDGISDDGGSTATLIAESLTGPLFQAGSELLGTVELTDLERNEQVVVRIDVKLFCNPGSNPTGNLQADLADARLTFIQGNVPVSPPQAVPGGAQTIPFKQIGNIAFPALDIQKTVRLAGTGDLFVESLPVSTGDTVEYQYVVSNPGDAPLYNVTVVTDDAGTPGDSSDDFTVTLSGLTDEDGDGQFDDLAAGASATATATVTITTAGVIVNTASVSGDDAILQPTTLTDSDTATVTAEAPPVFPPDIALTKTADPTSVNEPGGDVTFTVVVVNNSVSDATLNSLTDSVYGDLNGQGDCAVPQTLAADGGSYTCSFTAFVSGNSGDAHTNVATAVASNDAGSDTASDDATVTINNVPSAIEIIKTANPTSVDEPGGSVTFSFTVNNLSTADSVTITSLTDTVYGDLNGQGDCAAPQTIAAGGSYTCSISAFVGGMPGDTHTNVATASGVDDDGQPVSDDDDATVTVNNVAAAIEIIKTASPESVDEPGGSVTFSFTVNNLSTVDSVTINSLTDTIYGDLNGQGDCAAPQTLAPNGSYSCSFTAFVAGNAGDTETNVVTASGVDDDGFPVSDDDDATVTITDIPSAIEIIKTASPTSVDEPGGDVTYSFTINNLSAVDSVTINSLTDTVYGDLNGLGDCAVPQTIAAGGSYTCEFTAFVSSSETNVVTASGLDDDGNPVSDDDDAAVTVNDSFTNIAVTKTASPTGVNEPGGDVTFSVTIDNPSTVDSVTINSLTDSIYGDLNGLGNCAVPQTIAAGGSYTCEFTETVSGNAGDSETDVVTASGVDEDGVPVSDSDDAVVTVNDVQPAISVVKTASPTSVDEPGDNVTFTVAVTNDSVGSDPVTINSLTDSIYGDLNGQGDCSVPQTIAAGGSYTCSFTAFVSGNAGDTETDIVTASGADDEGNPVSASDDAVVTINDVPASILTTKTASPASVPETGGDVTFTITVENTSAVDTVTINSVVDSEFGDVSASCTPALPANLAPGESVTCTFAEFISGDYPGSHTNVATASGVDDDGNPVEDDDQEDVPFEDVLPDISVTKTADPASVPETGGDVTFTFVATNNSSEAATLDSLVDDTFGDLNGQGDCSVPQPLAANGGSYSCSITVFLSADDLTPHTNVVTATASDDDGNTDEASDDETVTFTDVAPEIDLTKSASPNSVPETGGDVTFTFTVDNIGQEDVSLTSLTDTVFGDLNGQGDCSVPQDILIGDSYTCSITVFLSADDLTPHTNVATATAVDDDGTQAEDSDDETVTFEDVLPDISVVKTANPTAVPETGGDVTFTFVVTNNSDEDATIDSLFDTVFGTLAGDADCQVGTALAGGESCEFSITETLSGDYAMGYGRHQNTITVTASDNDGNSDQDSDDAIVLFTDVLPDVSISKTADQDEVFAPGEDVEFTIVVTNNSLEDATIDLLLDSDFDLATNCPDAVGATLGYGQSYTCTFTEFIGADHENTATVVASDNDGNSDTESATETVGMINPSVDIEKSTNGFDADAAPGPEILAGAAVTWEYVVTNNGDVDLTNITVTDSVLGSVCAIDFLAVGDSATCTATGAAETGQYANTGTASVSYTDADGDTASRSDSDDSHYFGANPSISINKQTADDYGNEGDALGILPGETVTWNYYVENTGNVALENVSVSDDQGVTVTCPQDTLAVSESMTCTASGIAGEGWYYNVGTASSDYSDDVGNSATVTDSDGSSYYGLTPGAVTNSQLCDFGDTFRLLFTPDMSRYSSSTPYYKLSDSNPGQTFYNVFYVNDGSADTITMEIPYPYVTQGANPVHVYGGLTVDPNNTGVPTPDNLVNCFLPTNELAAYGYTFGLGDYTDTNGDGKIGYGDVYLVEVPAELGFQYINIHLDYGLEKTDGWLKKGANATSDGTGKNPAPAGLSINDNTAHEFNAYADGVLIAGSADTVYNLNEFKQIRGFGGLVQDAGSLDPVAGAQVQLLDSNGNLIETMTTDGDGWYLSNYVHKGKTAAYTLKLVSTGDEIALTVGGKDKFGEGSFLVP